MNLIKPNFWKNNNLIVYLIWPLTLITRLIIKIQGMNKSIPTKVKSICVGNIYLGGTGKTQLVIKVNEILKKKYKVYTIKKNYKNQIDEQKLLKKNTNLIISKRRIDGIGTIKFSRKNIALFDDGLQDKSIKYDLSIVCFNSISSVGNGHILPAGPLREDLSRLKHYDIVFINGKKNIELEKIIKKYNNQIKIFNGKYILKNKKDFKLKYKYLAFCGIGTPESFFDFLKINNIKVKERLIYPDHYKYNKSDVEQILKIALDNNLKIVTTEKDYMKLKKFKNLKVKYTDVDLSINNISLFKKFLINNL